MSSGIVPEGYTAIYTADDFDKIRNNLSGKYILMNDIDLSDYSNWKPIGQDGNNFSGILEGNGHVVKNLKIDRADEEEIGLFGATENAEIKNLGVINCNVKGSYYVGGLVGNNYYTKITKCYTTGAVSGEGGIGGMLGTEDYSEISSCYSSASVTGTNFDAGGLIGSIDNSVVSNCYATGAVSGEDSVGGLLGENKRSEVSKCYASNTVTGVYDVGGLSGEDYKTTFSDSFWDMEKSGLTESYGDKSRSTLTNIIGLTTAQMADPQHFIDMGWDAAVWDFSSAPPKLRLPKPPEPPPSNNGGLRLQIGANAQEDANAIYVDTSFSLTGFTVDFSSALACASSIDDIDSLIDLISRKISDFGAIQNRLESVQKSQITQIENFTSAKSTILDADIAQESAEYVKNQILQQSTSALLTQAQRSYSSAVMALIS